MKHVLRDNGLTIVLMAMFLFSLAGMVAAGFELHNRDLGEHGQAMLGLASYLTSGEFLSALFENWESEFLQMAAYVVLTAMLFQRGSAKSRDPGDPERPGDDALSNSKKRHSMLVWLYTYSLGIALAGLFVASFSLHWWSSLHAVNAEAALHGERQSSLIQHLTSAELWFESFQNWQSEFLSTAVLVVLSIFLRHKGSPESKPVAAGNEDTALNRKAWFDVLRNIGAAEVFRIKSQEHLMPKDPQDKHPQPPMPEQQQAMPGYTDDMDPRPDHGEETYRGNGKLAGRVALITGADSGIGRAVAIAFAREGADIVISYLEEDEDAAETARWVEEAGRKAILAAGDIGDEVFARSLVKRAVDELGRIDILVNNAAHQATFEKLEDITSEEWDLTFRTNVHAMFYLSQEAVEYMEPGSTIINTSSINATSPSPTLLAYATTKGAIANFTAGLAGLVADRGIRVNAVAPGPIWTPLIPSTMPVEKVRSFGENTPLKRPGQPAELAATYVLLASDDSSYTTGALYEVTGGRPML